MNSILTYLLRLPVVAAIFIHGVAAASITVTFDQRDQTLAISGVDREERIEILANPSQIALQVAGVEAQHSMPLSLELAGREIVVTPKFELLADTDYVLNVSTSNSVRKLAVSVPPQKDVRPKLTGFSPTQAIIPENTLRIYLHFSEPMAVGQLQDSLVLLNQAGEAVENPFLKLKTELWDRPQKRATVIVDPGRVKRGVGPNSEVGTPLRNGERYRLKVSASMSSAKGVALGDDITLNFRVGPAERRRIDPQAWQIVTPEPHTSIPITVAFDRIMDSAIVNRLLSLQDSNGKRVVGHTAGDGGGWALTPEEPWKPGTYFLEISPDIEDVSGNTIRAPFDTKLGTTGNEGDSLFLEIKI